MMNDELHRTSHAGVGEFLRWQCRTQPLAEIAEVRLVAPGFSLA
jgi:hypothetical protein